MELDLDLSLSPHTNSSKFGFCFDLNKHCATEGMLVEVVHYEKTKQTRFESMFWLDNMEEDCYVPKPCSFSLNGQPDEEDEDPLESDSTIVDDEEEDGEVVGWPPIKSCMTKYHNYRHSRNHPYHHHGRRINIPNPTATIIGLRPSSSSTSSPRSSMYVKVKMDGVAIARKVDIKLFNSYESLTNFLITMFTQSILLTQEKQLWQQFQQEGMRGQASLAKTSPVLTAMPYGMLPVNGIGHPPMEYYYNNPY
ncbi:hypothetical protein YC2023_087956 [Brassica napus]